MSPPPMVFENLIVTDPLTTEITGATFGQINDAGDPRIMQLGLKFGF
jgi:hypothetical protein